MAIEHDWTWRRDHILPVIKIKNGMSWFSCLFQLLFSIQGPVFFILPNGFQTVGYLIGIIGAAAVSLLYIHTMQIYLWCETELRKKNDIAAETNLSIYSLVDHIFANSKTMTRVGQCLNAYLKYEIIFSWSLNLSFNEIFMCQNIRLILRYFGYTMTDRMLLLAMFPFTALISFVPNLKIMAWLAYISTVAIVAVMLEITYFIAADTVPSTTVDTIGDWSAVPTYLATVFFTINLTPLIFPLKHEMKKQHQFGSTLGSFNTSIMVGIIINICFAAFAYLKYGNAVQDNIIKNLPQDLTVTLANCLLTAAITASGAISFYIIFETVWCGDLLNLVAKSRYLKLYEYITRTFLNLLVTVSAIAIPSLDLFINMLSCFSFSYDGIFLPAILQSVYLWSDDKRDLRFAFLMIKNILLFAVGIVFSLTTFMACISEIKDLQFS